jgi:hypothetical protein
VCNSRQAKSYRLKNLTKTVISYLIPSRINKIKYLFNVARFVSTQNGVNSIIHYFAENEKGYNSVSGMAFGEKAEKLLASSKAVEFSQLFRKSFSVEEISKSN